MERSQVASLWIGGRLSYLDLLCLKAFDDIGQRATLFSYQPIENLPKFVHAADAREIFDTKQILLQRVGSGLKRRSPAVHADIFRLHLLHKTDFIWTDTDAYPIVPFTTTNGYLFGKVAESVLTGVLSLPPDSHALKELIDFVDTEGEFPPWWDDDQKAAHKKAGLRITPEYFPWGTYGPDAVRHFLKQTGEIRHAAASHVLYPVRARQKELLLTADNIDIPKSAMSVHLYASGLRPLLRRHFGGELPEGSFLAQLCAKHGIDPKSAPL